MMKPTSIRKRKSQVSDGFSSKQESGTSRSKGRKKSVFRGRLKRTPIKKRKRKLKVPDDFLSTDTQVPNTVDSESGKSKSSNNSSLLFLKQKTKKKYSRKSKIFDTDGSSSTTSKHSQGSRHSLAKALGKKTKKDADQDSFRNRILARRNIIQQKLLERQKLTEEILAAQRQREKTYIFRNVTADLAGTPGKLELHPTKYAPTLAEVENKLARQKERERLKFFSVPIKIYDPDEHGATNLSAVKFTEEDRIELNRYGSRVVMRKDGRVAALEVEQDVMNQFKKKQLYVEICQCVEKEFEVSDKLKENQRARRMFMAKVLILEAILRLPSLFAMHYQKEYIQLHDFIYQQILLIFFMIAIVQGTRLAGIYFSEVGRFEPCRTIITVLTMIGYCMMSVLITALIQQYSMHYVEYKLHEDPSSLETLQLKINSIRGKKISYPYIVILLITYLVIIDIVLSILLVMCPKRGMNELGNSFLVIILLTSTVLGVISHLLINVISHPYFTNVPLGWDRTQLMCAYFVTNKWAMWRFYSLQRVVKGKLLKVTEDHYQFIALSFAI